MELKRETEEEKKNSQYDAESLFDPAPEPQTVSKERKRVTDDYSRSSSNTGYSGTSAPVWEEGVERGSFKVSEKQAKEALAPSKQEVRDNTMKILKISEIIMYVLIVFMIAFFFKVNTCDKIDLYFELPKIKTPVIIVIAYFVIDSILVFVLEKKNIGLFLFATVLFFVYPIYRARVVDGRVGLGVLFSIFTLMGFIVLFISAGQTNTRYGVVFKTEDDFTRHTAYELMEQTGDNSQAIGPYLQKKLDISGVEASQEKDKIIVTFSGKGTINFNTTGLSTDKPLNTKVVFEKKLNSKKAKGFEIKEVYLEDGELTKSQVQEYWNIIESN